MCRADPTGRSALPISRKMPSGRDQLGRAPRRSSGPSAFSTTSKPFGPAQRRAASANAGERESPTASAPASRAAASLPSLVVAKTRAPARRAETRSPCRRHRQPRRGSYTALPRPNRRQVVRNPCQAVRQATGRLAAVSGSSHSGWRITRCAGRVTRLASDPGPNASIAITRRQVTDARTNRQDGAGTFQAKHRDASGAAAEHGEHVLEIEAGGGDGELHPPGPWRRSGSGSAAADRRNCVPQARYVSVRPAMPEPSPARRSTGGRGAGHSGPPVRAARRGSSARPGRDRPSVGAAQGARPRSPAPRPSARRRREPRPGAPAERRSRRG